MKTENFKLYFIVIFLLGIGITWRISVDKPQKIPKNQKVTLAAVITIQPQISNSRQIIKIGDARLFAPPYPKYAVGDRLKITGLVESDGRIFNAQIERLAPLQKNGKGNLSLNLKIWLSNLRNQIAVNINRLLPEREAALVSGMVLGIDSINRDFRDQLIKTGTIHVVVVSGQNLSIVAALFLGSAKYLGRRLSFLLSNAAILAYATLVGFEPPVLRAVLMVFFSSIAIYYGREKIALWSLILSALVILFFAPQALFEISFQLTFAATLGIMTLGQFLSKIFNFKFSIFNLLKNNAAIATSAFLFTAPIIFWHFQRISLLTPIVNVLIAEAVIPIMILGFLIAPSSLISMPLAQLFAYLAYVPALYFVKTVEIFANLQ